MDREDEPAHDDPRARIDALLPVDPPIVDGYVKLGQLHIEVESYDEFREAVRHIGINPETAKIVEALQSGIESL